MNYDNSNMLEVIDGFKDQCRTALELAKGAAVSGKINKIVVMGMGGSAVGGDLLRIYMKDAKIPVTTARDYKVPNWVDENTLVFAVSYSGNTEETISALVDAEKKKAKIVAVTSGGKIASMAKKVIKVPSGMQPRASVGYLFFPVLGVLSNSGIVDVPGTEIKEMLEVLEDGDYKKTGQSIAKKIYGKIPVIYASDAFGPVAYRWKTQINENSKWPAFSHVFAEMNHNEVVGYQNMPRDKFIAIYIKDKDDHERIRKRMDVIKEISRTKFDVEEVETKGSGLLARIFSGIHYADYVSYYLALMNKIDPTPVNVIENLKKKLME